LAEADPEQWWAQYGDGAYRVDARNGTPVYADDPTQLVMDDPDILTYVNGPKRTPSLDGRRRR
jgi:hypothetical protein